MKILISGATGMVGSAVRTYLLKQGHDVARLTRSRGAGHPADVFWNPETGDLDRDQLEGFDGIIHLAGENIATGRWTETKKKKHFTTDENGVYAVGELPTGIYDFTFEFENFDTKHVKNLKIEKGKTKELNISLVPSGVTEIVGIIPIEPLIGMWKTD